MSEQTIVNNYNVDFNSVVANIAANERQNVFKFLVEGGILIPQDGGFVATAYRNFAERDEEGHEPNFDLITIGVQNTEAAPNDAE